MASVFPGGLDNFTNPTASDTLDSATVPHADQHANANDAIEAVESTLGVNPQGASATVVARLGALDSAVAGKASTTHASTHALAGSDAVSLDASQITAGTLPVLRGGTGVTTSTGTINNVLSASPTLTGIPTTPTAAIDTSTTQLASTAFVTNQASSTTSPMDGTATVGTSKRYARQDHIHPSDTAKVNTSLVGAVNGVASLDGSGLIPTTQLPPLAVNDTFVVASQAAMLALTAQVGDVAVRTDETKTYILQTSPATTLTNWIQILTPPAVTSVTASAPLTGNTITSTGTIGLDQTALAITPSQVTGTAVITNDARLSDTRTPTDASVTDAKIATTLSASKITGVAVTKNDTATVTGKIQAIPSVNFSLVAGAGIDTFSRHSVTSNGIQTAGGNISVTTFQASDSFSMAGIINNCTNTPSFGTGTLEFYLFAYDGVNTFTPKGKSVTYTSITPIVTGYNTIPITAFSGANLNLVAGSYYAIGRVVTTGFTLAPIFMSSGVTNLAISGSTQNSTFCGPMLSATGAQGLISTTTPITYTVAQANPVWYRVL